MYNIIDMRDWVGAGGNLVKCGEEAENSLIMSLTSYLQDDTISVGDP